MTLHFNLIEKDEGLSLGDAYLAEAIWRNVYQLKYVNPAELEKLIVYMRQELCKLDQLTKEQVLTFSHQNNPTPS